MPETQNLQSLLAAILNEEILCSDKIQEQLKELREVDFTLSFKNGKFTVSNPIVKAKPFNFHKHDIDVYVAGSYNPQKNKIGIGYLLDDGENTLEYSNYTILNNQQILPEVIGEISAVINAINLLTEQGINMNQNIKLFIEHAETDPWNYEEYDLENKFIYDYSDFMKFQEKSMSIIFWENTSNLADQKLTKEAKKLAEKAAYNSLQ